MPRTAGCVEIEGLVFVEGSGAQAVFTVAQAVVHVAEADEGEGFASSGELRLELGDRLSKIWVTVVAANGVPVLTADVFGLVAEAGGSVVADKDEVRLAGTAGSGENFGGRVLEAGDAVAIAVEGFVAPFGTAPAKRPSTDDAEAKLGEVEAVVADIAVLKDFELGREAIVDGWVVGPFASAPGGCGVPGIVVAEDGSFGQGEVGNLFDNGEVFVAEVTDEEDEVNAQGLEGGGVVAVPLLVDISHDRNLEGRFGLDGHGERSELGVNQGGWE